MDKREVHDLVRALAPEIEELKAELAPLLADHTAFVQCVVLAQMIASTGLDNFECDEAITMTVPGARISITKDDSLTRQNLHARAAAEGGGTA